MGGHNNPKRRDKKPEEWRDEGKKRVYSPWKLRETRSLDLSQVGWDGSREVYKLSGKPWRRKGEEGVSFAVHLDLYLGSRHG
jgi:hypothetical protein